MAKKQTQIKPEQNKNKEHSHLFEKEKDTQEGEFKDMIYRDKKSEIPEVKEHTF